MGQAGLIMEYEKVFERHGRKVAQILLTSEDLTSRKRYLNARNTLNTLLEWKIVPIINENDTVSVEEIKLGDNDNLAAMISLLMDADLLIMLSDIDGLFTKDPRTHADAELIPVVAAITKSTEKAAGSIPGPLGTGGMMSKITAARKVNSAGVPMVIAKGDKPDILTRLLDGRAARHLFCAPPGKADPAQMLDRLLAQTQGQPHGRRRRHDRSHPRAARACSPAGSSGSRASLPSARRWSSRARRARPSASASSTTARPTSAGSWASSPSTSGRSWVTSPTTR